MYRPMQAIWFTLAVLMVSIGLVSTMSGQETPIMIRPPQFTHPPSGVTVKEHFTITLESATEEDCVSLIHNQATLLISHPLLEQLKTNIPNDWTTEEERTALIQGRRAEALLKQVTKDSDEHGCLIIQTPAPKDSLYLLGKLLDAGQIAVIDNESGKGLEEIVVTFSGVKAQPHGGFGQIMYAFTPQSPPFLVVSWWVS